MNNLPGYVIVEKDPETRRIVKEALTNQTHKTMTICEELRFIYDKVYEMPDSELKTDLTDKLIDAFYMGKKMNSRLAFYKRTYIDKTGHRGKSLVKLEGTSERTRIRAGRKI